MNKDMHDKATTIGTNKQTAENSTTEVTTNTTVSSSEEVTVLEEFCCYGRMYSF